MLVTIGVHLDVGCLLYIWIFRVTHWSRHPSRTSLPDVTDDILLCGWRPAIQMYRSTLKEKDNLLLHGLSHELGKNVTETADPDANHAPNGERLLVWSI